LNGRFFKEKKMNDLQNVKTVLVTPPGAIVDNAAFTTAAIDTLGFAKLLIIVAFGAMDIAIAALKLRESDDDSTYSDVSGADFSVSPLTLPSATADNTMVAIHVDLRGKKRYMDLSLTGGDGTAGTYATVLAILSNGSEAPNSATERGYAQEAIL
jgi:hypothetical protein